MPSPHPRGEGRARRAGRSASPCRVGPDVALAVSYWCEGAKATSWNPSERISWMNSDPMLVRLFLEGLRLLGVESERIGRRLQLHETANERQARDGWAEQLGWSPEKFMRTTLKRHNPRTMRKNRGEDYHGCLTVPVLQSRGLYQVLHGLMLGLAAMPRAVDQGDSMGSAVEAV